MSIEVNYKIKTKTFTFIVLSHSELYKSANIFLLHMRRRFIYNRRRTYPHFIAKQTRTAHMVPAWRRQGDN